MTSQINPNNIDGTFPIAGQDNSSQGFRDNFTNIKNNFTYAQSELSALQTNAVQIGVDNNLGANTTVRNGAYIGARETIYALGSVSGTQSIDWTNGSYQTLTLAGSVTLSLTGFTGTSGQAVKMRIAVTVPNVGYTLTLPSSVSSHLYTIEGASGQTITFVRATTHVFELTTLDGGTTFSIADVYRNRTIIQGNLTVETSIANVTTTGISLTVSNVAGAIVGNITATNFIGNIISTGSNSASYTGNITANNITANTGIYGSVLTASQTNITLLGTLSSLSVTGNANIGNITVSSTTDFCGAIQETGIQLIANAINAGSTTIYSNVSVCIVQPNAAISSYSLTMPSSPINGQMIRITFANTITTLTHSGGSNVLKGAFTTANANVGGQWMYHTSTGAWYKMN